MARNIEYFNNGLDVDTVVDSMEAGNGGEVLKQFFAEAAGAEFIVPYRDNEKNLVLFNSQEKGRMLPAFSSFEAFQKSPLPKDKAVIMPFMRLDSIMNNSKGYISGIVINPHGKSLTFQHKENKPRLNGQVDDAKSGEMQLSKCEAPSEEMTFALSEFFKDSKNVYRAFFLNSKHGEDTESHLFILIDFDGREADFFPKVGEVLKGYLTSGEKIELAKANLKLLNIAEKLTKPFFRK